MTLSPLDCKFPGIYRFTNLINGKIYVGQAKNIYRRYLHHSECYAGKRGIFPRAIKKHGIENFRFEVLERVEDISLLDQREQYWLDTLRPYLAEIGYNIQVTPNSQLKDKVAYWNARRNSERNFYPQKGLPGQKHSQETKLKLSALATGRPSHENTRIAASNSFKGIPKTAEQNAKRARSLSRPIAQIDPATGRAVRVWLSAQYAAKKTGLTLCTIRECCMGYYWDSRAKKRNDRTPFYAGFNWQYATPEQMAGSSEILVDLNDFKPKRQKKLVAQINIESDEVLKVWPSIQQASTELDLVYAGIAAACKGRYWSSKDNRFYPKTTHAGYRWEYVQQ